MTPLFEAGHTLCHDSWFGDTSTAPSQVGLCGINLGIFMPPSFMLQVLFVVNLALKV